MTTTSALSRRALFSMSAASLAASAVAAAPAALASIPALMPATTSEVDARLWQLARALGPMGREWFEASETHDAALIAYMKQAPRKPQPFEGAAAREWEASADEIAERVRYHETKEAQDEARERLDAIHEELRELTSVTFTGLHAKAEAVKTLAYDREFETYVEEFYETNGQSPESMALVVVRDLLRMMAPLKS